MKPTFKEFLIELDRSDYQLSQQHGGMPATQRQQQAQPNLQQGGSEFKDRMAADIPEKGDIIQTNAGNFNVTGRSLNGVAVKQIDGGREITVPHKTKFKMIGQEKTGAKVWEVIK